MILAEKRFEIFCGGSLPFLQQIHCATLLQGGESLVCCSSLVALLSLWAHAFSGIPDTDSELVWETLCSVLEAAEVTGQLQQQARLRALQLHLEVQYQRANQEKVHNQMVDLPVQQSRVVLLVVLVELKLVH
jgi:hypothetical protein